MDGCSSSAPARVEQERNLLYFKVLTGFMGNHGDIMAQVQLIDIIPVFGTDYGAPPIPRGVDNEQPILAVGDARTSGDMFCCSSILWPYIID